MRKGKILVGPDDLLSFCGVYAPVHRHPRSSRADSCSASALEAPERATGAWKSHLGAFAHAEHTTSKRQPEVLDRVLKSLNEILKDTRSPDAEICKKANTDGQKIINRLFRAV